MILVTIAMIFVTNVLRRRGIFAEISKVCKHSIFPSIWLSVVNILPFVSCQP